MSRNILVFGFGLAVALVAGWVGFPRVLYVQRQQPLEFRHKTHAEKSGIAECSECHALRKDGAFAGIPAMEKCAGCHSERIGESKAEAILVDNFIKTGHETPWLVYARQPANVWFSHAIHVKRAGLDCTGMPCNVRRIRSGARLSGEPHQRIQPRYLGPFDLSPAAGAA